MHDPDTLAFEVKLPLPWKVKGILRNDPPMWKTVTLANIWHHDPQVRGSDDSCGWFMRARHCDQKILERIVKRFEDDWDRTFTSDGTGRVYFCGLFCPNGGPNLSVQGIVLNLFFLAACEHFGSDGRTNWDKARKWMRKNLVDILFFAENPTDSLFDSITMKWGIEKDREQRIRNMAGIIYSWICREERPWYKHPRWHIWHWQIQVPFFQWLKRGLFDRCAICGKGFKFGEGCIGNWDGNRIWHDRCDSANQPKPNVHISQN